MHSYILMFRFVLQAFTFFWQKAAFMDAIDSLSTVAVLGGLALILSVAPIMRWLLGSSLVAQVDGMIGQRVAGTTAGWPATNGLMLQLLVGLMLPSLVLATEKVIAALMLWSNGATGKYKVRGRQDVFGKHFMSWVQTHKAEQLLHPRPATTNSQLAACCLLVCASFGNCLRACSLTQIHLQMMCIHAKHHYSEAAVQYEQHYKTT